VRHEFLIRRLHSLSGLIPVGAFMCVHLLVNSSVLNSPETFQNNVYGIHALGKLLPIVEWVFIFIPLLFHMAVGIMIAAGGMPNTQAYPYGANIRYTLQRATGIIAAVFIMYHVFHMHGWFHFDGWLSMAESVGGHKFRPYNASSTAGAALQNPVILVLYAIGIIASVFHLANGLWTMGITWGVWTRPAAQKNALVVCSAFGVLLGIVGLSALAGMYNVGKGEAYQAAIEAENRMYEARVEAGSVQPNEHKRIEERGTRSEE